MPPCPPPGFLAQPMGASRGRRRARQALRDGHCPPHGTSPGPAELTSARLFSPKARSLQAEVMKLKLRSTLSRNPRCPALSGSHSLGPAASQSRNIFFNTKY